jgi:hypothetical protein
MNRSPTIEELLSANLSEKVSTRELKSFIEKEFSPISPAYRVIMPERDELTKSNSGQN